MIWGHSQEIRRELNTPSDLDTGPVAPFDETFAAWDPSAHVLDDLFDEQARVHRAAELPAHLAARARRVGREVDAPPMGGDLLAEAFRQRLPAEANQAVAEAYAGSDRYIARYNIWMHHLVDAQGRPPVPRRQATAVALEPAR